MGRHEVDEPDRPAVGMPAAKAWTQAVITVLAATIPALTAGPLTQAGWVNIVILATGAVMVYASSNDVPGWGYVKLLASAVSAAAVIANSILATGGDLARLDSATIVQMGLAAAGAVGVAVVPNQTAAADPA